MLATRDLTAISVLRTTMAIRLAPTAWPQQRAAVTGPALAVEAAHAIPGSRVPVVAIARPTTTTIPLASTVCPRKLATTMAVATSGATATAPRDISGRLVTAAPRTITITRIASIVWLQIRVTGTVSATLGTREAAATNAP